MDCEKTRELLPDYLLQTIGEPEKAELEAHLDSCQECRAESDEVARVWARMAVLPEEEPGAHVRTEFYASLESESRRIESARQAGFWRNLGAMVQALLRPSVLQMVVPALFLLIGVVIGHFMSQQAGGPEQVSQLRTELESMKSLVTLSLLEQQSASERLRGITWGTRLDEADTKVLRALISTMNSDPSVNVRLAAVDALQQYSDDQEVRDGLVRSLSTQDSPLVQIALIDTMVHLREHRSVAVLRHLADDRQLNKAVRDRAKWGLQQLV